MSANSTEAIPWFDNEVDFETVLNLVEGEARDKSFTFKKWLQDSEPLLQQMKNEGTIPNPQIVRAVAFKEWIDYQNIAPSKAALLAYLVHLVTDKRE